MAVEVSPYLLRRLRSLGEVLLGDGGPEQGEGTPPDSIGANEAQGAAASDAAALPPPSPAKEVA